MNEQKRPPSPLVLADVERWRGWLEDNEGSSGGLWLMLAKKGVTSPTSITYQDALEEAPKARSVFEKLSRAGRYAALHPLLTAASDDALDRRVQRLIARFTEH